MKKHQVVVTGIGIVSSHGEGVETHLAALNSNKAPVIDAVRFAPFSVHPAAPIEFERQIAKKADLRQMEPWQKLGVYAAGAALSDAGLAGEKEALASLNMIVACGGGERDYEVDGNILSGLNTAENKEAYLNERLMSDIRPTLFLAQLSNLLAGNIAIVHGVTGPSRTFMGEEQAGVDAIRVASARIQAGQGDAFLVGGATNAEREDLLLIYEMAGLLWKHPFAPVENRAAQGGGFIPGTVAAFLVLEEKSKAMARGAKIYAELEHVVAGRSARRQAGDVEASLHALKAELSAGNADHVFSGATGVAGITDEEAKALVTMAPKAKTSRTGNIFGHSIEAQFPAAIALAAANLHAGNGKEVLVTSVGHWRGEGLALLKKSGGQA